jgi:hypothetical protein
MREIFQHQIYPHHHRRQFGRYDEGAGMENQRCEGHLSVHTV